MRLVDLLSKVPSVVREGQGDAQVTGLVDDSRKVTPGALFVARGGAKEIGRAHV